MEPMKLPEPMTLAEMVELEECQRRECEGIADVRAKNGTSDLPLHAAFHAGGQIHFTRSLIAALVAQEKRIAELETDLATVRSQSATHHPGATRSGFGQFYK